MKPTVIPDIVWDVFLLFPLLALAIGTSLQAQHALDEYRDHLPAQDLFLRSTYVSGRDTVNHFLNLIGRQAQGRHADTPPAALTALRSAQAWTWLVLGAALGLVIQLMRIVTTIQAEGVVWQVVLAAAVYAALVAWRGSSLARRPELRPSIDGQPRRNRIRRLVWTLLPMLPVREVDHLNEVKRQVKEFAMQTSELSAAWPYWLSPPRVAVEPDGTERVVVIIERAFAWSADFDELVKDVLDAFDLRPRPGNRYGGKPIKTLTAHEGEESGRPLDVAFLTRFAPAAAILAAVFGVDAVVRALDVAPWGFSYDAVDMSVLQSIAGGGQSTDPDGAAETHHP